MYSDSEAEEADPAAGAALADAVLCSYIEALGGPGEVDEDGDGGWKEGIDRVREEIAGRGASVCLICLERITVHESVWECGGGDEGGRGGGGSGEGESEGGGEGRGHKGEDSRADSSSEVDAGGEATTACYNTFHLVCIQSWARQSMDVAALAHAPALERG
jgi:hypothetical protein